MRYHKKRVLKRMAAVLLCSSFLFTVIGCGRTRQIKLVPYETSMEDNYRTYYEVFVYSFCDGNGDGIGDFQGLTKKLDYINDGNPKTDTDLGCNGIWLMPVMKSPSYHKYDVMDYYTIDPEYGTMEDFEQFMAACNERQVKVIMDLVLNHTSSQHPWFLQACEYLKEIGDGVPSGEECKYVDYYHFSREKKEKYEPVPGSDVWYYEAVFDKGMPDLNLYNEDLRKEIEEIVQFWLDKGVGGFRLDAAKEYITGNDEKNIEILRWLNEMVKDKKEDAYLVAEVWTDINTYAKYYESGIDSIFDFAFANKDGIIASVVKGSKAASSYGASLENAQAMFQEYNTDYVDAPFYTNHDMARSAGFYSGENAQSQTKVAGALNLLMSGSAFVYYGEELGMKGSGRDENKRAPMYFSKDKNADGMCLGPENMETVKMKYDSLEEQQEDEYSIYQYYKKAIRIRMSIPAITKGKCVNLKEYSDDTLTAFTKYAEDENVWVFCNLSPEHREVILNSNQKRELLTTLTVDEQAVVYDRGTLELPPYGIAILKLY